MVVANFVAMVGLRYKFRVSTMSHPSNSFALAFSLLLLAPSLFLPSLLRSLLTPSPFPFPVFEQLCSPPCIAYFFTLTALFLHCVSSNQPLTLQSSDAPATSMASFILYAPTSDISLFTSSCLSSLEAQTLTLSSNKEQKEHREPLLFEVMQITKKNKAGNWVNQKTTDMAEAYQAM
ncbi:hypothetical protein RJT34_13091 [Clitoria ternatea]|uniref:Uncharacterized protein n=1 Tax=Clitoria ternatea TaxID=43366 RepID=A0AAN9PLE0_CLITE